MKCIGVTILIANAIIFPSKISLAQGAGAPGLAGVGCNWKRASCGLFKGSYEACLVNGDGNQCPSCGSTTRTC